MAEISERYRYRARRNHVPMSRKSKAAREAFVAEVLEGRSFQKQDCFLCQDVKLRIIGERDRYGFWYPTGVCERCGTVQQAEYYDHESVVTFYSSFYRAIYGSKPPESLYADQMQRGSGVWEFLGKPSPPGRVLEVGCGPGGILAFFRDLGFNVLGLDFDESYLKYARLQDVPVFPGQMSDVPAGEKFDYVILSHVLEHLENPVDFLVQVRQRLCEGGLVYVEVPSLESVRSGGYDFDLLNFWQNAHTVHFTALTLRLFCRRAGLREIQFTDAIQSTWEASSGSPPLTTQELATSCRHTQELLGQIETTRRSLYGRAVRMKRLVRNSLARVTGGLKLRKKPR